VIRLFNLYIPTRLLLLTWARLLRSAPRSHWPSSSGFRGESHIAFNDEHAFFKDLRRWQSWPLVCSHFTEFYDLRRCSHPRDVSAGS